MGTGMGYSTKATTKSKQKKFVKTSCQMSKTYTIIGTCIGRFTKSKGKKRKKSEKKRALWAELDVSICKKDDFFVRQKTCKKQKSSTRFA